MISMPLHQPHHGVVESLEPRIRFARSEDALDHLVEEVEARLDAGELSKDQADRLTWLIVATARQLARGLVNVPMGSHDTKLDTCPAALLPGPGGRSGSASRSLT